MRSKLNWWKYRWPRAPRISPDGRWLAYSAARDITQVFVRPRQGGSETQVSVDGGREPVWAPDSRRLFYRGLGGLVEVELTTAPSLTILKRRGLFDDPYQQDSAHADYDVAPDGRSFVMLVPDEDSGILVALNWADFVSRRWRGR